MFSNDLKLKSKLLLSFKKILMALLFVEIHKIIVQLFSLDKVNKKTYMQSL